MFPLLFACSSAVVDGFRFRVSRDNEEMLCVASIARAAVAVRPAFADAQTKIDFFSRAGRRQAGRR
jgi:hypothetical protein